MVSEYIFKIGFLSLIFSLSGCSNLCGFDSVTGLSGNCRDLSSSFVKTQIGGFAACGGTSRKIKITCAANSGSNSACTSRSNGSGYFFVVFPGTGGVFVDSNYTTTLGNPPLTNCNDLWAALNAPQGSRPSDIIGFYYGAPAASDTVACTDVGGCSATAFNCISGWDPVQQIGTGAAVSISNGTYQSCAFIDSPWTNGTAPQGSPPASGLPAGLIATSAATTFGSVTFSSPVSNPTVLSTWVNY